MLTRTTAIATLTLTVFTGCSGIRYEEECDGLDEAATGYFEKFAHDYTVNLSEEETREVADSPRWTWRLTGAVTNFFYDTSMGCTIWFNAESVDATLSTTDWWEDSLTSISMGTPGTASFSATVTAPAEGYNGYCLEDIYMESADLEGEPVEGDTGDVSLDGIPPTQYNRFLRDNPDTSKSEERVMDTTVDCHEWRLDW